MKLEELEEQARNCVFTAPAVVLKLCALLRDAKELAEYVKETHPCCCSVAGNALLTALEADL